MSTYLNDAAVAGWKELDDKFDQPLRRAVSDGQGADMVDAWMDQMMRNAHEMAADDDAPDAGPVRRIGRSSQS